MTDTAASLVEYTRKAAPEPVSDVVSAVGSSLTSIQQAGRPGLMILQCITLQQIVLDVVAADYAFAGGPSGPKVRTHPLGPGVLPDMQKCCSSGRNRAPLRLGCSSRSVLCRPGAAGMSRAPAEVWSISTPAACLLLSRFAPATAQLFAEFRRLRNSLLPAEARKFAECEKGGMRHAEMMAAVRLCACPTSRAHARASSGVCSANCPAPPPVKGARGVLNRAQNHQAKALASYFDHVQVVVPMGTDAKKYQHDRVPSGRGAARQGQSATRKDRGHDVPGAG